MSPRRLRVVYVDHVARLSGAELALARMLPALGDSVDAVVVLGEDGRLVPMLEAAGARVVVRPLDPAVGEIRREHLWHALDPRRAARLVGYTLGLARWLRTERPDLVHTNTLKAGVYGSIAARLAGVPVVWHVRDRLSPDYLSRPSVVGVRVLLRALASAVIANSGATLATLGAARRAGVPQRVIGEALPAGPSGASGSNGSPRVYGMVGRLAPWKGQDVFLRAFARAFPDPGADRRAVIVGGALFGEDDYGDSLPSLAQELGIAERVEFRGFRENVDAELARMDVLVHASVTPEPFGQVILEGMRAGIPVIASAGGGAGEIVEHGSTGLLHPPGDAKALAACMRRLAGDAELRDRLIGGGRERVRDFRPEAIAGQVLDVYRTVTGTQ